jgi:hypothetical protein
MLQYLNAVYSFSGRHCSPCGVECCYLIFFVSLQSIAFPKWPNQLLLLLEEWYKLYVQVTYEFSAGNMILMCIIEIICISLV